MKRILFLLALSASSALLAHGMNGCYNQRGYDDGGYRQYNNSYSGYNGYTSRDMYRDSPQIVYAPAPIVYAQPRVIYVPAPVYYGYNDRGREWHDHDRWRHERYDDRGYYRR